MRLIAPTNVVRCCCAVLCCTVLFCDVFCAQCRIPTVAGTFTWQDFADAVHASHVAPAAAAQAAVPAGRPGSGVGVIQMRVDGSPAEAVLGIKYKSIPQIVDAEIIAFDDYAQRGWSGVPGAQVLALN